MSLDCINTSVGERKVRKNNNNTSNTNNSLRLLKLQANRTRRNIQQKRLAGDVALAPQSKAPLSFLHGVGVFGATSRITKALNPKSLNPLLGFRLWLLIKTRKQPKDSACLRLWGRILDVWRRCFIDEIHVSGCKREVACDT